jgi:hypothetical protein
VKHAARPLAIVALVAVTCLLLGYWPHVRNEFFVLAGSRNETGGWYGFHSGLGGAAYLSLPVILAGVWWHHQCHVHGCFWYARRVTAAGERACWKHHPEARRTVADLHAAHHEAILARLHRERRQP